MSSKLFDNMGSSTIPKVGLDRTSSNTDIHVDSSLPMIEDSRQVDELPSGLIPAEILSNCFRFDKQLGEGSYGSVYEATYAPNMRKYVVKIVRKRTQEVRTMALHEARVGMTVLSKNVCKTIAYSEDEKNVYIIMEHILGMDLFEFISKNPNVFLDYPALTSFVIKEIVSGIKDMHDSDVVHADLKAENIFIGVDEKRITCVKIIDFGLSKPISEIRRFSGGTHDYMAPEIAKNVERDAKIDIWSIGITIYVMLMVGFPLQITSRESNKHLRESEVIRNLCSLRMDEVLNPFQAISTNRIIAAIQRLIMACLTVDPKRRPSSQELLAKIDEFFPPSKSLKKDA